MTDNLNNPPREAMSPQVSFFATIRLVQILKEMAEEKGGNDFAWMSLNHLLVLLLIFEWNSPDGVKGQHIADMLNVNKATANRIINALAGTRRTEKTDEQGGKANAGLNLLWLGGPASKDDRRVKRIHLTDAGKALRQRMLEAGTDTDAGTNPLKAAINANKYMAHSDATVHVSGVAAKGQVHEASASINIPVRFRAEVEAIGIAAWAEKKGVTKDYFEESSEAWEVPFRKSVTDYSKLSLSRAMRNALETNTNKISISGMAIECITAEENWRFSYEKVIETKEGRATNSYQRVSLDGYWMLFHFDDLRQIGTDKNLKIRPRFIQKNLGSDEIEQLAIETAYWVVEHNIDASFIFNDVREYVNAWQFNIVTKRALARISGAKSKSLMNRTHHNSNELVWSLEKRVKDFEGAEDIGVLNRFVAASQERSKFLKRTTV